MPFSYWVDEGPGVLFFACAGRVTAAELARFVANRDAEIPAAYDTVVDLSNVTELDVTADFVGWLARGRRDRTRLAIVAPRPALLGLSRMFQIHAEIAGQQSPIRTFNTRAEAVDWLRIERGRPAGE